MTISLAKHMCFPLALILALFTARVRGGDRDLARCASQGDPPDLCSSKVNWDCNTFITELKNFALLYRQRPNVHNNHGMGVNHAFSLWFVLKKLQPMHVIESGVLRGQGTWLIRNTVGPEAKIYSIDPRKPASSMFIDKNPNTTYFMGADFKDFSQISWKTLIPDNMDRQNALVVLDDHMSSLRRLQQIISFGFSNLWYDDNWKYGKVDVYSFNIVCSQTVSSSDHVLYLDNFGTTRVNISMEEHAQNVKYLQSVIDSYYEFPAIYNYCDDAYKSMIPAKGRSCLRKEEARQFWYSDLQSKSNYIAIDFLSYFPPYVKLKTDASKVPQNETTPYILRSQVLKSAGAAGNDGAFIISGVTQ